jgi:hypothetical protein
VSPRFATPKSKTSRRTIPLPPEPAAILRRWKREVVRGEYPRESHPPELVAILRAWKATQNEERLLLGPDYRDQKVSTFRDIGGISVACIVADFDLLRASLWAKHGVAGGAAATGMARRAVVSRDASWHFPTPPLRFSHNLH